jgi:hypothetical protein
MYLLGMPLERTRMRLEPLFPQSAIPIPIMRKTRLWRVLYCMNTVYPIHNILLDLH